MFHDDVARLRSAINKLSRQFNLSATDEGLTPTQASCLGLIDGRGPITLAELTRLEGLHPTMMSRVIGKLDELGLVRRIANSEDLRSAVVEITKTGRRTQERIKRARAEVISEYLGRLAETDRVAIIAALPALEALAQELGSDRSPGNTQPVGGPSGDASKAVRRAATPSRSAFL